MVNSQILRTINVGIVLQCSCDTLVSGLTLTLTLIPYIILVPSHPPPLYQPTSTRLVLAFRPRGSARLGPRLPLTFLQGSDARRRPRQPQANYTLCVKSQLLSVVQEAVTSGAPVAAVCTHKPRVNRTNQSNQYAFAPPD